MTLYRSIAVFTNGELLGDGGISQVTFSYHAQKPLSSGFCYVDYTTWMYLWKSPSCPFTQKLINGVIENAALGASWCHCLTSPYVTVFRFNY